MMRLGAGSGPYVHPLASYILADQINFGALRRLDNFPDNSGEGVDDPGRAHLAGLRPMNWGL
ncbi:hypothetical protein NB311A_13831 [Nitrobacter sp. Nb-311A]|nr:hypothetical protein NB311A_13831 [Nitrobacter sp. Nb-311A]